MPKGVFTRKIGRKYKTKDHNPELIIRLYQQGLSIRHISGQINKGRCIISKILKEEGVCRNKFNTNTVEDFFRLVDVRNENECWEWLGPQNNKGYGQFRILGHLFVHRFSYQYFNGHIIDVGLFVCHSCDNPICVNPNHLFLGTRQDNINDKVKKGRSSRKVTDDQVREIRLRNHNGEGCSKLAASYSLGEKAIRDIVKRKYHKYA